MSKEEQEGQSKKPCISIIIPAYNASSTIEKCLTSLFKQTFSGEYEILVVDNGSTDDTISRVKNLGCKFISVPDASVYGARNQAANKTSGEILAFIDSDCIADPSWLEEGVALLNEYDIVAGKILPQQSKRYVLYNYDMYVSRVGMKGVKISIAAGNALMHRSVFNAVGGFDGHLQTAGDSIFSIKARHMGFTIGCGASAIVYHPVDGVIRRLRGAMREGQGSVLKAPHLYGKGSVWNRMHARVWNLYQGIKMDMDHIKEARRDGYIDQKTALAISLTALFFRATSYASTISARMLGQLNSVIARK